MVSALGCPPTASSAQTFQSTHCQPPEKWVCLTFDDGPSKTTPEVLAALDAAGVHGTFFVVATGYNEKYLPLLTQAAAAGHQIALHSASHGQKGVAVVSVFSCSGDAASQQISSRYLPGLR